MTKRKRSPDEVPFRAAGRLCAGLVALAAAASVSACKKSGTTAKTPPEVVPVLGPVMVQDFTPPHVRPPGISVDEEALSRALARRLSDAALFAAPPRAPATPPSADPKAGEQPQEGDAPRARFRVEVALGEVTVDEKKAARAVVRLRADVHPSANVPARWREDVQAAAETVFESTPETDRSAVFAQLVSRVINDLSDAYITRQRVWIAPAEEVARTLESQNEELAMEAMRAAAERRLSEVVPLLLARLESDDEAIRDAALGALVEMGERKAVSVLTKGRSMRDTREMRKILDAMAVLGGKEAEDYLSFVAETHDDAEIRDMASQAKERMARRGQGASAARSATASP